LAGDLRAIRFFYIYITALLSLIFDITQCAVGTVGKIFLGAVQLACLLCRTASKQPGQATRDCRRL
jgi:hypothetical protein